ncbi:MAG: formylglycine-generating enzyme family protein [Bryobacterales bacterium]|nr:formylglycine-generating enzyme family protein [Bryobacterales bacterium]
MSLTAFTVRLLLVLAAAVTAGVAAEPGMVFIPGGEFTQGRNFPWPDADVPWYPTSHQDDHPPRKVTIEPLYLDEGEVTNERYAAFVKAKRHRAPYHWIKGQFAEGQERFPVVNVSWDDAVAFCEAEGKRLPTEAEWERAARGGVEKGMFPWGDRAITTKDARFNASAPVAVCSKEKNRYGLCDMIGNVWEWTADWYSRTYYTDAKDVTENPKGPEKGMYRVLRGGSWFDQPPLFLMVSYRSWARPGERSSTIGFRCAKGFGKPGR